MSQHLSLQDSDIGVIQKALNQMHKNIVSLMKINHQVMVGKRNANCIACAGPPAGAKEHNDRIKRGSVDFDSKMSKFESLKHV